VRLASSALVAGSTPGWTVSGFFVLSFLAFVLWDCHIFFMISFTCLSQLLCSGFLTFDECFLRLGVSATRTFDIDVNYVNVNAFYFYFTPILVEIDVKDNFYVLPCSYSQKG
jgi:hypothetical protein